MTRTDPDIKQLPEGFLAINVWKRERTHRLLLVTYRYRSV